MAGEHRSSIIGDLKLTAGAPRSAADQQPVAVVLELNARFPGSPGALTSAFFQTWAEFRSVAGSPGSPPPGLSYITSRMYQAVLSRVEVADLIAYDRSPDRHRPHTIFKAWPDYILEAHIDRSMTTVKADAAFRAFSAAGHGVVWAVIDSGIDASHPHFGELGIAQDLARQGDTPPVEGSDDAVTSPTFGLHRDFTELVKVGLDPETGLAPPATDSPLTDDEGHGTHVAGIIAGRCPDGRKPHIASGDEPVGLEGFVSRAQSASLFGMAQGCELVSLKVLRLDPHGLLVTSSSAILRALDYIRTEVNTVPGMPRIHGVNISIGCEWDAAHYAAGRSPLCQAIDELARSGVVVVVSAGNGGQAQVNANDTISLMGSITEPAHADKCIAVGSTHRDAPHVFGITYTSGKGPTLDGRCKPDVVAPGEWITSAATGRLREHAGMAGLTGDDATLTYAPDSGTSMAAPHVSGVIAAFLSVHPEFIGQVDEVKKILCENATDLGRERYAQGHGLVDLMRMLSQS